MSSKYEFHPRESIIVLCFCQRSNQKNCLFSDVNITTWIDLIGYGRALEIVLLRWPGINPAVPVIFIVDVKLLIYPTCLLQLKVFFN